MTKKELKRIWNCLLLASNTKDYEAKEYIDEARAIVRHELCK